MEGKRDLFLINHWRGGAPLSAWDCFVCVLNILNWESLHSGIEPFLRQFPQSFLDKNSFDRNWLSLFHGQVRRVCMWTSTSLHPRGQWSCGRCPQRPDPCSSWLMKGRVPVAFTVAGILPSRCTIVGLFCYCSVSSLPFLARVIEKVTAVNSWTSWIPVGLVSGFAASHGMF